MQLHNLEPFRVQTVVQEFPPFGHVYQGNLPVQLFDQFGNPQGVLEQVFHTPRCQANADCNDLNPCTADSCEADSGLCLHAPLPDGDGDGVCDLQDNCPSSPNPGQGPVVFPDTILAPDRTQFCWSTPVTLKGVRGQLNLVSAYAVDNLFFQPFATCFPIAPTTSDDYYLVEPDCPTGSWQTTVAAETARDATLP
jgi:hypothetical protein